MLIVWPCRPERGRHEAHAEEDHDDGSIDRRSALISSGAAAIVTLCNSARRALAEDIAPPAIDTTITHKVGHQH